MKAKTYILLLLFLSAFLAGCSVEDSEMDTSLAPGEKKTQVVLTLSIPAVSIPQSTRAVTEEDESTINELAIWVFDKNDEYLYQVSSKEDEEGIKKVVIRGNKIYATLRESETPVKLAMIANASVSEPRVGQNRTSALASLTFGYSPGENKYIPMYGESQTPFIVKEGVTPDGISLKRALARVEVNASNALPNFRLESATVVNINTQGTIVQSNTITNSATRTSYETNAIHNKWVFYIPEAANVDSKDSKVRTSIILKGEYKNNGTKYYRLDFIKRTQNGTDKIDYEYISTIKRNYRYVFHIENMVEGAGHASKADALSGEADNKVVIKSTIILIDDENIRDITTDSQYYLGITSDNLIASVKQGSTGDYYTVGMSVVTNNPDGWFIEDLPYGVEVSTDKTPSGQELEKAASVWVYIKKSTANPEDIRTIYIYSGNIRKTIKIKIQ